MEILFSGTEVQILCEIEARKENAFELIDKLKIAICQTFSQILNRLRDMDDLFANSAIYP